jgi:hypothetical protein
VESVIEAIVREYGRPEDTVGLEDLRVELLADPIDAACNLVAGLHSVDVRFIPGFKPPDDPDALRVVWRLRALRLLTGCLDFRAPTKENPTHPDDAGRQFLEAQGPDRIPFFATWMSRDRVFLAPLDTQRAIVEQWRSWYAANGPSYAYRACGSVDDWYF